MNWKRALIIPLIVFFVVLGLNVSGAYAWKVTVTNPTNMKVTVSVFKYNGENLALEATERTDLAPNGGSHIFDTGLSCPSVVGGHIFTDKGEVGLQTKNCLGNDIDSTWGASPCCWNTKWKICKKRDNNPVQDKDYGFCKD